MLGSLITFVALMFDFMTVSYQQIEAQDLWPTCIQIRGKGAYETIAPRRMHRTDARQFFKVLLSPPVANLTIDPIQLPWFEKNSCYSALSSLRPVSFGFLVRRGEPIRAGGQLGGSLAGKVSFKLSSIISSEGLAHRIPRRRCRFAACFRRRRASGRGVMLLSW
jgi:hypothetical protein